MAKLSEQSLAIASDRIVVMCGDAALPYWGLSDADRTRLRESSLRAIIHNAAYVNHALRFRELYVQNVASTHTAIQLAAEVTAYTGAPCHTAFISTGGVCGRLSFAEEEEPLRLPGSALVNQMGYVQTKWVSERIMENAGAFVASIRPLSSPLFSIYRPGAVTCDSSTGASNIGDSINRHVIGWILLGVAPPIDSSARVDMSPVDWNAGAIAGIVLQHSCVVSYPESAVGVWRPTPVYTLDNGHSLQYSRLLETLSSLGRQVTLSETYADWLNHLTLSLRREDESSSKISCPNPLRSLLGSLVAKQPKFGSTGCRKHMDLLSRHGFPSPMIDDKYLSLMLRSYVGLGALPPT
jgi:thioester reductase-like protein